MLVIDRKAQVGDDEPGVHALIIGISDYSYLPAPGPGAAAGRFGFYKVQGPAASAIALTQWLAGAGADYVLAAPLKTVRLLLLPSAAEAVPAWPNGEAGPTDVVTIAQAVEDWRNDCNTCEGKNIALFYFGGHGINFSSDDVLLAMGDVGHPADNPYSFERFLRVKNIFEAMQPSDLYMNMARTQFYFIDACRTLNSRATANPNGPNVRQIFTPPSNTMENRVAPIFFAAQTGDPAFAPSPEGTKYGLALIRALKNSSAAPKLDSASKVIFPIGTDSLEKAINNAMRRDLPVRGYRQDVDLVWRRAAPDIELQVEVRPPEKGEIILLDGLHFEARKPIATIAPIGRRNAFNTPAGQYSFDAKWMPAGPVCFSLPSLQLIGPTQLLTVKPAEP